jgi:hypothetical protein
MSWTGRLWLLAATLSLVLAAELAQAPVREPPAANALTAPRPAPLSRRGIVPADLRSRQLADDAKKILARPLFAPSRRSAAAAPAVAAAPPRLTGVIIAPDARLALFASTEGKVTAVASGHSIAGYVVRSISLNKVVVSGPTGERELRTSFVHVTPHVIHAR